MTKSKIRTNSKALEQVLNAKSDTSPMWESYNIPLTEVHFWSAIIAKNETIAKAFLAQEPVTTSITFNHIIHQDAVDMDFLLTQLENSSVTKFTINHGYYTSAQSRTDELQIIANKLKTSKTVTSLNYFAGDDIEEGTMSTIINIFKANPVLTDFGFYPYFSNAVSKVIPEICAFFGVDTIKSLSLSLGRDLKSEEIQKIAEVLKTNKTLTALDFGDTHLWKNPNAIIDALAGNQTLTSLDLSVSYLGSTSTSSAADIIQKNNTLTSLKLNVNHKIQHVAQKVAASLKENYTLTTLEVFGYQPILAVELAKIDALLSRNIVMHEAVDLLIKALNSDKSDEQPSTIDMIKLSKLIINADEGLVRAFVAQHLKDSVAPTDLAAATEIYSEALVRYPPCCKTWSFRARI